MLRKNYSIAHMNELELVSIYNFAIKETYELISDEVEFYFSNKAHLIDIFAEGLDYKRLNQKYLQDRFDRIIYSPKEIETFISRLEGKILKELSRVSIDIQLDLNNRIFDLVHTGTSFVDLDECLRTYSLSCFTEKMIDKAWRKSSSRMIPPSLSKISNKVKMGEYFMSVVGLKPNDIERNIATKIKKSLQGVMKHKKNELTLAIKNEVLKQLLIKEELLKVKNIEHEIIKTA